MSSTFRPGSIRKLEIKDFITYSYVQIVPGPNLNMIIGPNGTGKSSIAAAIILGLGGSPKDIGRARKLSEYVKHGSETALINTYLQENEDKWLKISRKIDIRNKSTWKLNDVSVGCDEILNQIRRFNVQIDNLCQFLPQDRVQEFARLSRIELLRETQSALCRYDLIEKQKNLMEVERVTKELQMAMDNRRKRLQECVELNKRLEGKIENYNKMKMYKKQIEDIDRKIAWISYEEIVGQLKDIGKDKRKAQEIFDKFRNKINQLEKTSNKSKNDITDLQRNQNGIQQVIRDVGFTIEKSLDKFDSVNSDVNSINDDMEGKLEEIQQWNREIEQVKQKSERMRAVRNEAVAKLKSKTLKQALNEELSKLSNDISKLGHAKEQIKQCRHDNLTTIQTLESELERMENVKQTRLERMRRINPDSYRAVVWLRDNKVQFEEEIFEPIMLILDVFEPKYAKFIEKVISQRDCLAFTCVNKRDMNKFITILREQLKLKVNVLHSSVTRNPFEPIVPIENLRKFGFYAYLTSLFSAPDPVMNYICRTYNVHNIPLGELVVNECFSSVPNQYQVFFSENYMYNVRVSKYSGKKSVSQNAVNSNGNFSLCLDMQKMNALKGQISELKRNLTKLDNQYESMENQFAELTKKINGVRGKLEEIEKEERNIDSLTKNLEFLRGKLEEMERMRKSPDQIRAECSGKREGLLKSVMGIQKGVVEGVKKISEEEEKLVLNMRRIEMIRKQLASLENYLSEKREKLTEASTTLNTIKQKHAQLMETAKIRLKKAKNLSENLTPSDENFKKQFGEASSALPGDMHELNQLKCQLQSFTACLNIADDRETGEYEARLKEIDFLTKNLENQSVNLNENSNKMAELKDQWLGSLDVLIDRINLNFSRALGRLGCAGQVAVCPADEAEGFDTYGVSVKVAYRNGEELKELNGSVQSGGERAVATAAYLMALQELTPAPFRCVDEINQGMDATNERRIFDLVVKTCDDSTTQYFLITPKLIPNLKYSEKMSIHIVHNGPFVRADRKWGRSKLCNPMDIGEI